jgi:ribosome-binding protein aMBF1 (putative translation factor)
MILLWRRPVIRSESEYREAVKRIREEQERMTVYEAHLREQEKFSDEAIERVIAPIRSFHLQMVEKVQSYERLKRGEVEELRNLRGLGHLLIALRIARGFSQRQLAERLGVHETQVSRDERNEYFGITLERAAKILDSLGIKIRISVDMPEPTAEPVGA